MTANLIVNTKEFWAQFKSLNQDIKLSCIQELEYNEDDIKDVKAFVFNPTVKNKRGMRGQAKAERIADWMLRNTAEPGHFTMEQVDLQEEINKLQAAPEQVEDKDHWAIVLSEIRQLSSKLETLQRQLSMLVELTMGDPESLHMKNSGPGEPISGKKAKKKVKKHITEAMAKPKKEKKKDKKKKK